MPRTMTDFEYNPKTDSMDRPQNRHANERVNAKRANEAVGEHRRGRQQRVETQKMGEKLPTKAENKANRKTAKLNKEIDRERVKSQGRNAKLNQPKNVFNRPLPGSGAVSKVGNVASKVVGAGARFAGVAGAAYGAYQAGDFLGKQFNKTDAGKATRQALTDFGSKFSGVDDLQDRMLSDDPEISKAAVAEYNAQGGEGGPENTPQAPGTEEQSNMTPATAVDEAVEQPDDLDAAELGVLGQSRPANVEVNAGNPEPIANSSYEFAGKYGDTDVITRPAVDGQGERYEPNVNTVNGQRVETAVPEFTDLNTVNGMQRPGQQQGPAMSEQERIEQSREDYRRNTTMSDGRRAFGGSATEELRSRQMEVAGKGDPDGTVARQLADEGRTPEQRAAYAADPAGAYNVDASAEASNAKSQLESFKHNFQMAKDSAAVGDRRGTEARRAATDAGKQATNRFKYLELLDPRGQSDLEGMANQLYAEGSGSEAMPDVLDRIYNSIEFDENGIPLRDPETGGFVPRPNMQLESNGQRPEVSVHI